MADRLTIAATTHGRVLVQHPQSPGPWPALIGFHGYAENAAHMLDRLRVIPGSASWLLVSVQALHRFYARDQETVVGCWMTREDRETEIADNLRYVADVIDAIRHAWPFTRLACAGFSQGVAMAYRAALRAGHDCHGVVALGGDIPPELMEDRSLPWPPVLVGRGSDDAWYARARFDADVAFLRSRTALADAVIFEGGHEWTPAFAARVGGFLAQLVEA